MQALMDHDPMRSKCFDYDTNFGLHKCVLAPTWPLGAEHPDKPKKIMTLIKGEAEPELLKAAAQVCDACDLCRSS